MIQTLAVLSRNENAAVRACVADEVAGFIGRQTVDFIEDAKARARIETQIRKDLLDIGIVFGVVRVRDIGDLENQGSLLDFLQGGAKSGDQARRKVVDETDGI